MNLTPIEREIIVLKSVNETVDEIVNYEVIKMVGVDPYSQIRFNSITHQRFFNIILLDFLSPIDQKLIGTEKQLCLKFVEEVICQEPMFNINNSIQELNNAVKEFMEW